MHLVRFPRCNFRCPILPDLPELAEQRATDEAAWRAEHPDAPEQDDDILVGVRVLSGLEIAGVLEDARKFAKARGVDDPKEGNPLYDLGVSVHTLAVAYIDPDATDPESPAARFFDGGVQQILDDPNLGRDGIIYLHEQQETWQDLCSPQASKVDAGTFDAVLTDLAGEGGFSFFCQLRPGLRWVYMRSMASLLVSLQTAKSAPGSYSETSTTVAPRKTPSPKRPTPRRPAKRTGSKRRTGKAAK